MLILRLQWCTDVLIDEIDVGIDKILISRKLLMVKCFINTLFVTKIKEKSFEHTKLPKIIWYGNRFNETI